MAAPAAAYEAVVVAPEVPVAWPNDFSGASPSTSTRASPVPRAPGVTPSLTRPRPVPVQLVRQSRATRLVARMVCGARTRQGSARASNHVLSNWSTPLRLEHVELPRCTERRPRACEDNRLAAGCSPGHAVRPIVARVGSSCHGQQQSRLLSDGARGCGLLHVQVTRPRQLRRQPELTEEYGTHDQAPSKLCTRTLPNAWRTPLPSLARSQWT